MARSKNRVLAYDAKNADEVTVQLELDNGEVVQARYSRVIWLKPTKDLAERFAEVFSGPPVQTLGSLKSAAGKPEERNS